MQGVGSWDSMHASGSVDKTMSRFRTALKVWLINWTTLMTLRNRECFLGKSSQVKLERFLELLLEPLIGMLTSRLSSLRGPRLLLARRLNESAATSKNLSITTKLSYSTSCRRLSLLRKQSCAEK